MNAASAMSDIPILTVEHLSMKFGGLIAIGDLSFVARRGEITALIGPNGAGKTTVFNCITGFYKPTEGMITLQREDGSRYLLERLPNHEIPARAKVARTFQNIRLFSGMTVLENLLVAQHNKLMKASGYTVLGLLGIGGYSRAAAESMDLAKFWLEKADLIDRADDPAGDLPYGAQRRLEIARAMCTGPELLCLDEPAAGLNPRESLMLNTLLNDIKDNTGTSILLIEHDMSVVMQISDHVVVLEYGRKISDGDPISVKSDPKVIAAYLGVDDEEVTDVLAEVGDESVIEQLDAEPDRAHGSADSSSMMAGPISDTVGHSDAMGERVTIARGASRAGQVEARIARDAAKSAQTPAPVPDTPPPASLIGASTAPPPAARPSTKPAKPAANAVKPASRTTRSTGKTASAAPAGAAPKGAASRVKPAKSPEPPATAAKPAPKTTRSTAGTAALAPATPKSVASGARPSKPAAAPALSNALPAPRGGQPDRLILIKGIGPVNERKLNEHGIFHFDQIAAWKRADIAAAEAYLAFDGRIDREDWIGQAKALAKQATGAAAPKRGGRK